MKKIMKVTVVLLVLFCSVNLLAENTGFCYDCYYYETVKCAAYQEGYPNSGICKCGHPNGRHDFSSHNVTFTGSQYHTPPIIEKEEWYETKWGIGIIAFIIIGIIGACYEKFIQ